VTAKVVTSDSEKDFHQESLRILKEARNPESDWLGRVKKDWVPPNMELLEVKHEFIHAKIYAVDGYAVMGSANLTEKGLWENVEHLVIFEGEEEAEQVVKDFEILYNLHRSRPEEIREEIGRIKLVGKLASIFKKFRKKKE